MKIMIKEMMMTMMMMIMISTIIVTRMKILMMMTILTAIMITPAITMMTMMMTLPNKYNYQQDISEPSPKCESQVLNFQKYCETLNKQCNQISEQQKIKHTLVSFQPTPKIISAYTPATSKG